MLCCSCIFQSFSLACFLFLAFLTAAKFFRTSSFSRIFAVATGTFYALCEPTTPPDQVTCSASVFQISSLLFRLFLHFSLFPVFAVLPVLASLARGGRGSETKILAFGKSLCCPVCLSVSLVVVRLEFWVIFCPH